MHFYRTALSLIQKESVPRKIYEGESESKGNFEITTSEQMHMLLLDIIPLHNDALLVSFNELLHPFGKKAFWLLMKPRLHRLLDVTVRAEPVLHALT
jgi:hypothetical protein